jgi:hypothetical protein
MVSYRSSSFSPKQEAVSFLRTSFSYRRPIFYPYSSGLLFRATLASIRLFYSRQTNTCCCGTSLLSRTDLSLLIRISMGHLYEDNGLTAQHAFHDHASVQQGHGQNVVAPFSTIHHTAAIAITTTTTANNHGGGI